MTDLDIQQAIASAEAKLSTTAYSRYLQDAYGLSNYCKSNTIGCLLLFLFALQNWDNRPGGSNPYTERQLVGIIGKINQIT